MNDDVCVELARFPSAVAVRDSKNPALGHLSLSADQFASLTSAIKHS